MTLESLYLKSPRLLQNLAMSAVGAKLNYRRYDEKYRYLENELRQRDKFSHDEILAFQRGRLSETLAYAQANVPYYQKLFKQLDCSHSDFKEVADLSALPVLNKTTVQANLNDFISNELSSLQYTTVKTSGTTGAGLVFPMTLDAEREQWALWWRYRKRFGLDQATWYAHFYGKSIINLAQKKPPYWRFNWPGKQIFFSAYHMTESNLGDYVDALCKYQPPWIQGYPSLLALMADFILSGEKKLSYTPRVITVGSESLLPQQKEKIEKAFGAPCRQHYGMTEAVANISECPQGHLHVDEDFSAIEFIDNDYGVSDMVCTGFANKAFVLLRYNVGDNASLNQSTLSDSNQHCLCGLPGRIVESIDGRIEDYILTPDGKKVGRLDHIVKDFVSIKECQIFQNDSSAIEFRVVKGEGFTSAEERRLLAETQKRLGDEINVNIVYHERLARSKTGKLRFVLSELPKN